MQHFDRSDQLGTRLIEGLRGLRDQLRVSTEGKLTVPRSVPENDILQLPALGIGILQVRRGSLSLEVDSKTYDIVFDLARLNLNIAGAIPAWLAQARLSTSEGTVITFRRLPAGE